MLSYFSELFSKFAKSSSLKNPIFYGVITLIILIVHWHHASLNFGGSFVQFLALGFCLIVESILEGLALCVIGSCLSFRKYFKYPFVILAAFLPVLHLTDFILERLFSLSIWHTLYSVFSQSLDNFLELLYATNLPLWTWMLGFAVLVGLGVLFVVLHEKVHAYYPEFKIKIKLVPFATLSIAAITLYVPLKQHLVSNHKSSVSLARSLPFKEAFVNKETFNETINLEDDWKSPAMAIDSDANLFIFIVESLRNDAIHKESAPCLTKLGQDFFRHNFCIAGANGTHLSWFSLFFSKPALFWKKTGNVGSPFLQDLKRSGYNIHVLSSARMTYYDMDKQIFGKNYEFIDEYFCPKLTSNLSAFSADKACFDYMASKLKQGAKKQAYVVFLDATHFGYSLPEAPVLKFLPCVDSVPYFSFVFSKINTEGIKNRYLNTIYSLDSLFEKFTQNLKTLGLYDQAAIMVTSDHGEEFYENGQLFHASHLSDEQLKIPFIMKTPKSFTNSLDPEKTFSHMDMFPFVRAVLSNQAFENRDVQIASRFNFSLTPKDTVLISRHFKAFYKYHEKRHELKLEKHQGPKMEKASYHLNLGPLLSGER